MHGLEARWADDIRVCGGVGRAGTRAKRLDEMGMERVKQGQAGWRKGMAAKMREREKPSQFGP